MEDKIYSKEEAFKMVRDKQEALLKKRNVGFKGSDKEAKMVQLIVASNPMPEDDPKFKFARLKKDYVGHRISVKFYEVDMKGDKIPHFKVFSKDVDTPVNQEEMLQLKKKYPETFIYP